MNKNVLSLRLKEYLFFNIVLISILLILMGKENVIIYSICMFSFLYVVAAGLNVSEDYNKDKIIEENTCYFWLRILIFFKIPLIILSVYSILAIFLPLPLPLPLEKHYKIIGHIYFLLTMPSLGWMLYFMKKHIPSTNFKIQIFNALIELSKIILIVIFVVIIGLLIMIIYMDGLVDYTKQGDFFIIMGVLSSLMLEYILREVMEEKMRKRFSFKNKIKVVTPYIISLLVSLVISVILVNII